MKIIGLTGPAGCGKTTLGDMLVEVHGFTRVKFADPLKDMLRTMYENTGLSYDDIERRIEGDLKEVKCDIIGCTPRWAMQTLGTDWGRALIHEDLWVRLAAERAKSLDTDVVFDDVRFDNEAETIRNMGGTVYGISGRGGIDGDHPSEVGVDPDLHIDNSGDMSSLLYVARQLSVSEP